MAILITREPQFDQKSPLEAKEIIYGRVLASCEAGNVYLSSYGNHAGMYSQAPIGQYELDKVSHKLFDIARVQKVFAAIPELVKSIRHPRLTTPDLQAVVEKKCGSIPQGEIILAMLLHGYKARFGFIDKPLKIRCEFNAVLIE